MQFTLATAQQFAAAGEIENWIQTYLRSGEWANLGLADGLKLAPRWWIGPVEMPLTAVVRCCGPEPEMEFRVLPENWNKRVNQFASSMTDLALLPPLIANYVDGIVSVRDGNHRHEAIRRKGWLTCWVLIWYDNPDMWRKSPYFDGNDRTAR